MINKDQCYGCGNCMNHCPKGLIKLSDELNARNVHYAYITDESSCIKCGSCELMCTGAAINVKDSKGYQLIDKKKTPSHSGCYLGSLTKALADVVAELDIQDKVVFFKLHASDVNLDVENHNYDTMDTYFMDALKYKEEHPEKLVIIILPSSKVGSSALSYERALSLRNEKVTIINTLNWFETPDFDSKYTKGGSDILEKVKELGYVSYTARGSVRTVKQMNDLKKYLKIALQKQMNNESFAMVQMLYPCFYRLANRPQILMPSEQVQKINNWFDKFVAVDYELGEK